MINTIKSMLGIKTVNYHELLENGAVLLDVRSAQEFNSGHAKGSKNIPLQNLKDQVKKFQGKEVVIVCQSGMRAAQAKAMFSAEGITAHNARTWTRFR